MDLYLYHNHNAKSKVKIINDTPYITLDLKLEGKIYSLKDYARYLDDNTLEQISNSASKYIELQMYNYLYKTSKKYKSDISGFGKYAMSNFITTKDAKSYNWQDNYQNSFFKVNCNVNIKSGYLISKT